LKTSPRSKSRWSKTIAKSVAIVIDADGTARSLVDEASERICSEIGPKISTRRASHVESWWDLTPNVRRWIKDNLLDGDCSKVDTNAFWADMLPVGGPVLGPYVNYKEAIDAEVAWLHEHNIPGA
jgi:hypothetical protein